MLRRRDSPDGDSDGSLDRYVLETDTEDEHADAAEAHGGAGAPGAAADSEAPPRDAAADGALLAAAERVLAAVGAVVELQQLLLRARALQDSDGSAAGGGAADSRGAALKLRGAALSGAALHAALKAQPQRFRLRRAAWSRSAVLVELASPPPPHAAPEDAAAAAAYEAQLLAWLARRTATLGTLGTRCPAPPELARSTAAFVAARTPALFVARAEGGETYVSLARHRSGAPAAKPARGGGAAAAPPQPKSGSSAAPPAAKPAAAAAPRAPSRAAGPAPAKPPKPVPPALPAAKPPRACRYGTACRNLQCGFAHPAGAAALPPRLPRGESVCRYGVRCRNTACGYAHPDGKDILRSFDAAVRRSSAAITQVPPGSSVVAVDAAALQAQFPELPLGGAPDAPAQTLPPVRKAPRPYAPPMGPPPPPSGRPSLLPSAPAPAAAAAAAAPSEAPPDVARLLSHLGAAADGAAIVAHMQQLRVAASDLLPLRALPPQDADAELRLMGVADAMWRARVRAALRALP
jgi:hypothetical protein